MVRKRMLICGIAIVFVLTLPLVSSAAEKTFVGSETCGACHSDQYADWKTTLHSKMVQDAKTPGAIIGDFSKNKWFKAEDVAYTLGRDNVKYYLRKDFSFLPASWNNETRQWTYAERPTPWSASCASCHTVGYNKEKKSWAELGIGCESCHGPGSAHVEGGGDKTQISKSVDNKVCATCHGGQAEQIETMGHSDIFMKALGTVDKPNKENWDRYAKSGCIRCHSATYILAPADKKPNVEEFKTGTLKDDRISITCAVCHDPHKDTGHEAQLRKDKQETCTQCHQSSGKITLGSSPHHTQKEIFEGALADGKPVEGVPSVPSKKVALCVDCHMPSGTHFFKAGTPTFSFGPDGFDSAHAVDERVSVGGLIDFTAAIALTVIRWCGVA